MYVSDVSIRIINLLLKYLTQQVQTHISQAVFLWKSKVHKTMTKLNRDAELVEMIGHHSSIQSLTTSIAEHFHQNSIFHWLYFSLDLPPKLALNHSIGNLFGEYFETYHNEFCDSDFSLIKAKTENRNIRHRDTVSELSAVPFTNRKIECYKQLLKKQESYSYNDALYIPTTVNNYKSVLIITSYNLSESKFDQILENSIDIFRSTAMALSDVGISEFPDTFRKPLQLYNETRSKYSTKIIMFLWSNDVDIEAAAKHFSIRPAEIQTQLNDFVSALNCKTVMGAFSHAKRYGYLD